MLRLILALFAALMLGGCALTDKLLTNRVGVTLAMDECRIDSRWLAFGISTPVADADCEALLAALRLRALQQAIEQQQRAAGSRM